MYKNHRKIISLILIICITVALSTTAFASETSGLSSFNNYKNEMMTNDGINGLCFSFEKFNLLAGQPNSPEYISIEESEKDVTLKLKEISIETDNIYISATINNNGDDIKLSAKGKLFNSYKSDKGVNSIAGDLSDEEGNFQIRKFEILYENIDDKVMIKDNMQKKAHVKLYVADKDDYLYLFEMPIPDILQDVSIKKTEQIDGGKDFWWFVGILKPSEQSIPSSEYKKEDIIIKATQGTKGVVYTNWVMSNYYYQSFYVTGDYYQAYSRLHGTYSKPNSSGLSSTAILNTVIGVDEYVKVNGVTDPSVHATFEYHYISTAVSCGAQTEIANRAVLGRYIAGTQLKVSGSDVYTLAKEVLSVIPQTATLSTVMGWMEGIISTGTSQTITLGSTTSAPCPAKTVAVSYKYGSSSDYLREDSNLSSTGHFFQLQHTIQKVGDSTCTTYGTYRCNFKAYDTGGTLYANAYVDDDYTYSVVN